MKPPSRTTRSTTSASQWLKRKPVDVKGRCNKDSNEKWSTGELRNIISGLRLQFKSGLGDIDTPGLQTRVPNRSVAEIELLLNALKLSVGRKVHLEVKKQRKEEHEQKVPIQVWTELMERIAGKQETKISSGFSRMLVIAGTEPCSLKHSVPPRDPENPSPNPSDAMSVRTIAKFSTGTKSLNSGAPIPTTANASQLSGKDSHGNPNNSSLDKNKSVPPKPPLSSGKSTEAVVSSGSATSTSEIQSQSAAQDVQTKALEVVQSRTDNTMGAFASFVGNSGRLEDAVDFEKIYTFLSTACKTDGEASLTAMECAVVLDLIMSLPEELPHMDCQSLQEHFLQVYSRLTTVVNEPLKDKDASSSKQAQEAPAGLEADEQTREEVSHYTKLLPTWESAGICPLNPLMVPLSLLKRKKDNE